MATQGRVYSDRRPMGDGLFNTQGRNGAGHCGIVVERPRLFAGLLPDAYAGVCRAATARQFNRGEMLHMEGDPVDRVLLLTKGSVKTTKVGRTGSEVIIRLALPGDFLGTEGLLWCGKHCTTAEVFRGCQALVWEGRVFKDLLNRYSILHQNMVAILDEHLRELEERFREVATDRVGARVALQLLRLVKTIGRPVKEGVEVGLSREELAQMTGTTLFTVSRLISAWEERGVVKPSREAVSICDVPSLCAISEED